MRSIQLRASKLGARIFRNNIGFCACRGRKIKYGVGGKGGADLIGWAHTGQFMAVEVKDTSRTTKEQMQFLQAAIVSNCIGILAHSVEEFESSYILQTSTVK